MYIHVLGTLSQFTWIVITITYVDTCSIWFCYSRNVFGLPVFICLPAVSLKLTKLHTFKNICHNYSVDVNFIIGSIAVFHKCNMCTVPIVIKNSASCLNILVQNIYCHVKTPFSYNIFCVSVWVSSKPAWKIGKASSHCASQID